MGYEEEAPLDRLFPVDQPYVFLRMSHQQHVSFETVHSSGLYGTIAFPEGRLALKTA